MCFHLMRSDGIVEDFSLNKCLTTLFPAWAQSRAAKVRLFRSVHHLLPVLSIRQPDGGGKELGIWLLLCKASTQQYPVQGFQPLRELLSCSRRKRARRHSAVGLAGAGGGGEGGDAAMGVAEAGGAGTEPGPSATEGCCTHLLVDL